MPVLKYNRKILPGEHEITFGQYRGMKVQDLSFPYVIWCLHPNRKDSEWYAALKEIWDTYESWCFIFDPDRLQLVSPSDRRIWFGTKHFNEPLWKAFRDKSWLAWCLHEDRKGYRFWYWLHEYKQAFDKQMEDKRHAKRRDLVLEPNNASGAQSDAQTLEEEQRVLDDEELQCSQSL